MIASIQRQASVAVLTFASCLGAPAMAQSNWQQQQQWQRQQDMQRQQQMQQQQDMQRRQMQEQQRRQMQEQQRRQMQEQQRQQMQAQQRQQMQAQQQQQQRQQMQNQQRQTADQQRQQMQRQGTLGKDGKATGVAVSGGTARMTRPLTPGEIQKGFTGRVTADGRALIRYQGRVFTVPASRVAGLSARLARQRATQQAAAIPPASTTQRLASIAAAGARESSSSAGPAGIRGQLLASTSPGAVSARLEAAQLARLQERGFKDDSVGAMRNPNPASAKDGRAAGANVASAGPAGQVSARWHNPDGSLKWPPNGGFGSVVSRAEPLAKGQLIDRYGDTDEYGKDNGNYFAPKGTPFGQRSLPAHYKDKPLITYEVLKELPVTSGVAAPWFDQPGGGKQFRINRNASELEALGYIRRVR